MPKSKRNKVVALTKTKKKGREWKEGLIAQVRACIEQYSSCYLFKHYNMRNEALKQLRESLADNGRFVLGSNKVLQVALGRTEADEYRTDLHLLAEKLSGSVGLFFTNLGEEEAKAALHAFTRDDFARVGNKATHDFSLPQGPVMMHDGRPMPHQAEPHLRTHGLPTKLDKGVVTLIVDHTVVKEGQRLTSAQAYLLRAFNIRMATFRLKAQAAWFAEGNQFKVFATEEEEDEEDEGEHEEGTGEEVPDFTFPEEAAPMLS